MAILSNGLLGSSRKKIGNIVTYRMKGQDVARSKPTQVDNPRTASQQTHRVKLANVVNLYKVNRPWMERLAFESKPTKWSVYNAFVSANLTGNRVYLTKQQADRGDTIVAPYKISNGSLPSIVVNESATTAGNYSTNLFIGTIDPQTATTAQVSRALLDNNNGLAQGMQISLIVNYQTQAAGRFITTARYFEVIIDTTDSTPFAQRLAESHIANVGNSLGFISGENDPVLGFAYILSQDVSGKTRVSTQYLILNDTDVYNSFGQSSQMAAACASYGATNSLFLAGGYQVGSDDNVSLLPSVLSIQYSSNARANVGQYAGRWGTESEQNLTVELSSAPEGVTAMQVVYQPVQGARTSVDAQSITVNGTTITATMAAESIDPSGVVVAVVLTLASGEVIGGEFATNSGLTPDSDVTE